MIQGIYSVVFVTMLSFVVHVFIVHVCTYRLYGGTLRLVLGIHYSIVFVIMLSFIVHVLIL